MKYKSVDAGSLSIFCLILTGILTGSLPLAAGAAMQPYKHTAGDNAKIRIVPHQNPVFKGRVSDPVTEIRYRRADFMDSVAVGVAPASLQKIQTIFLYSRFNACDSLVLIDSALIAPNTSSYHFKLPTLYTENDSMALVIAVRLSPEISVDQQVAARIERVKFSDASQGFSLDELRYPFSMHQVGIVVRPLGADQVHTYRIPGITATNTGRLIAVYDVRYNSMWDLPGKIAIGMSYSDDGGTNWSPMKIILQKEQAGDEVEGVGDACVLVDRITGNILVSALWSKGNRGFFGSGPGFSPEETGQWVMTQSTDGGASWSAAINLTAQLKKREWRLLLPGPGNGITLADGTLVFPAQYKDEKGIPFSTIVYSRDGGRTWQTGSGAKAHTTESAVVEISPGLLMLNMRDNAGDYRSISTSKDLGLTWQTHPSSGNALIDPICQGSLVAFTHGEKNVLAFSNPNTQKGRKLLSVKFSYDRGMTWTEKNSVLVDQRPFFGYSSIVYMGNHRLAVFYEGKRELLFTTITVPPVNGATNQDN